MNDKEKKSLAIGVAAVFSGIAAGSYAAAKASHFTREKTGSRLLGWGAGLVAFRVAGSFTTNAVGQTASKAAGTDFKDVVKDIQNMKPPGGPRR